MKIHAFVFKQIIDVGMPAGFQQALTSFSNVFVQAYINFFGRRAPRGGVSISELMLLSSCL